MQFLKWSLIVIAAVILLVIAAGQMGLLSGRVPNKLGVTEGRLRAPSKTPNSVSSQASTWADHARRDEAQIDPLPLKGDGAATLATLRRLTEAMPGATVVEARADYLYVQFTSRWLRFVDDTEFWFDPAAQVVQVRSASRVGRKDFGVNRARVEALRTALAGS